jgi:hypothetical protein
MRLMVIGVAAVVGIAIGTASAVAVAHKPVAKASDYDVASKNVDLAQSNLGHGDLASARANIELAKARTAACDADSACRGRVDNFNLHARLDMVERRVNLWSKK